MTLTDARRVDLTLLRDRDHYETLITEAVARARVSVWIATANVKDVMIESPPGTRARARGEYRSILDLFESLAEQGVELRLLHGAQPSRPFREDLAGRQELKAGALEMRCCPRVHFKMVAVDGTLLYLGSANLTGAGLGAKGDARRNFEAGIVTEDDHLLDEMQGWFQEIWSGRECAACQRRDVCPAPLDGASADG